MDTKFGGFNIDKLQTPNESSAFVFKFLNLFLFIFMCHAIDNLFVIKFAKK